MKRIAEAAAAQLATRPGNDEPITPEEMVRLLARIARTGPSAARLRAIELLGARIGLYREAPDARPALSEEERARHITVILERLRVRHEMAQAQGGGPALVPGEGH